MNGAAAIKRDHGGFDSRRMTGLLQRWRNRTGGGHPSEDRLLDVASGATDTAVAISTARHLRTCPRCTRRAAELRRFLDTVADSAGASFDEAFPPDRLRVQRARIDHRLARVVGTVERARVLSFPFRRTPERRRDLRPSRWAVAATAAGLALGMVAGQFVDLHRGPATMPDLGPSSGAVSEATAGTGVGTGVGVGTGAGAEANATLDMTGTIELPPASTADTPRTPLSLSEFEQVVAEAALLDALDVATVSLPVTELASIDALTPRVTDLAAAVR